MDTLFRLIAQIEVHPDRDIGGLPKGSLTEVNVTTAAQIAFGIAGGIALIIVMIGALRYVTSQGDPQTTAKAKNTVLYALIGLAICVVSFSIVRFVVNRV